MAAYADSDGTQSAPSRAHNLPVIYQPDPHLGIEWATSTTVTQPLLVLPDLDHSDDQLMRNAQADKMDEYIASIYTHITIIKSRRNTLLPVHQLPDEILTDIFLLVALSPQTPNPGHINHWSPLMLVCRRWRIVGVSSPVLWSHMHIYTASQSLLFLPPPHQRHLCANHLLTFTVDMRVYSREDFDAARTLLEVHANNIHALTIYGSYNCLETLLGSFCTSRRENLRALSISRTSGRRATDDAPFLIPAEASKYFVSNLQRLHLHNVALDWDVLQNLTSVEISFSYGRSSPLTLPLLLNMLRRSPALQSLCLSNFIDTVVPLPPKGLLNLPCLVSLVLKAQPLACAIILSALHIPPEVHISIHPVSRRETEEQYPRLFEALHWRVSRPGVPTLRTLRITRDGNWAWYSDLPFRKAFPWESPNLRLHTFFSDNVEVRRRLTMQVLRTVPSEKIICLDSGETGSVPDLDTRRFLFPLLPSLRMFIFRPLQEFDWFIILRECAAQASDKHLRTIYWGDGHGGRLFGRLRSYVSKMTANLKELLDTYMTHRRSVDKIIIQREWLTNGKEEVEFAEYARGLGVEVDISSQAATLGAIQLGAPKEAEEAT